jgi:DNA-binding Xre family transcriptional regulator
MAANRWSVSEVSRRCGLPRLTVRHWRDNRVTAYSRRVLERLCAGLDVQVGSLLITVDGGRKARTNGSARRKRLGGATRVKTPRPVARR